MKIFVISQVAGASTTKVNFLPSTLASSANTVNVYLLSAQKAIADTYVEIIKVFKFT
jgi:hypothetical protein